MTTADPRRGRPYRRAVALMWAHWREAGNGTMCHLCGHQGATEADHLDPVALDRGQIPHWTRMRPAHGVNPRAGHPGPCSHPDCVAITGEPYACNQHRGTDPLGQAASPQLQPLITSRKW